MAEKIESLQDIKNAAKVEAAETVRKAKKDKFGRSYATGKRKDAVARVWIKAGKGNITINDKSIDQYFARPRVSYSALKWLKVGYQVDLATTSSGFNLRFMPEITLSKKVGDFSFAFRQRVLTTWKVEQGTNSTVLRSRGKIDYRIPETPVSIHFAVEPYWAEFKQDSFAWLQKVRWYAGFDIKIIDGLTLRPEYLCQSYHNHKGLYDRRTYDDHIFYMTFAIKL